MGFANGILGGAAALIRAAIKSPNFVHGTTGWSINKDGSVEFSTGTFRGHIIGGDLFLYTGVPGLGNPPIFWASSAAVDPFGNALPSTTGIAGAGSFVAGNLKLTASAIAPLVQPLDLNGFNVGTSSVHGYPEVTTTGPLVMDTATIFSQPIAASVPGGTEDALETWHAMTPLLNSWAAQAAPNVQPQYRKVASPPNSVEVIGSLNASAATAITFFTLPAGYRPASQQPFHVGTFNGAAAIDNVTFGFCDTSGNLTIQQRIASATGIYFHGLISLDA